MLKLYDLVAQYYPEFRSKIEPNMGMSPEDEQKLIDNVNIVFHSAATVRFDEPLK